MSNIDELKLRALGIKEEVREGANTANRVGGLLYDIIDSMGGSGVQSDWNQGDSTQPDFIKHKPEIPSTAGLASEQYVRDYTYDKQTIDDKIAQGGTFDPTNYYTKREVDAANTAQDTEIAKKVNASALATVATSGSYNDLRNTPTIPAEQIQADWNQTNSEAKDFIKNKPNVPEGVIVDTELSKTSTNPVQNKVITEALENVGGNPDKPYNPESHSGLGRKTLELKEGGSNVLTQEDFSDANTIYVIQYDYDLNNETIDVPDNCIIRFDGGSIKNGTITNAPEIVSERYDCFDNISFPDGINNTMMYAEWWKHDENADSSHSCFLSCFVVFSNQSSQTLKWYLLTSSSMSSSPSPSGTCSVMVPSSKGSMSDSRSLVSGLQ
jgi:hypothetical protein